MAKTPKKAQGELAAALDTDFNKLSNDELTQEIAYQIQRCAEEYRMKPQDVRWVDFREYMGYTFGRSKRGGLQPKHITRVGGFAVIRDSFFPPEVTDFSIERENLRQKAKLNRSMALEATRYALLTKQMQEIADRYYTGRIVPVGYAKKQPPKRLSRTLNLVCSDWHVGAHLDSQECPVPFGPKEESRSIAQIALQTVTYKEHYRKDTALNLFLLGDMIQGDLRNQRDGAPLAEQIWACQEYLPQMIGFLARHFPRVDVYGVPGNHGRFPHVHSERGIHQKWNAVEMGIYHAARQAAKNLQNVRFHLTKRPWIDYTCQGQRGWASHGDNFFKAPFPAKSIPVANLEGQVNRMNAALPDTDEYRVVMMGHVHTSSLTYLPNGTALITNGALIPSDPYALSIGIQECNCGQVLFESVEGYLVGDYRYLQVGGSVYKDASLDRIVKPFEGLAE